MNVSATTARPAGRLSFWAAWFEQYPRPRLLLTVIILVLYAPALAVPFFIDDYRNLRLMREYHVGASPSPDLYAFFTDATNAAPQREAGEIPWWISDELRAAFLRPLAEGSLYLDYLLWGERAVGYHATALLLYILCIWLLLALFRAVQPDESRARWAALIFALTAGNAVTVAFIAARCDLLALLAELLALVAGLRYLRTGRVIWPFVAGAASLAALLSKEAAAPLVLVFALLWIGAHHNTAPALRRVLNRRAALVLVLLLATTVGWFAYRSVGDYAANAATALDPLHRPAEYLLQAPRRAFEYLASWPLAANPTLFYQHPSGRVPLLCVATAGAVLAVALAAHLWRRHRREPGVLVFAFWPLLFLPVLVCVVPDARLLLLPGVGMAFVGAVWLRSPCRTPRARWLLRRLPAVLLLGLNPAAAQLSVLAIIGVERKSRADLRAIAADIAESGAGREARVFLICPPQGFDAAWTQDRARFVLGADAPSFAHLCDAAVVDALVQSADTLRLSSVEQAFMDSLLGRYALPHGAPRFEPGQTIRAPAFTVSVVATAAGWPTVLDLRFHQPLDSPACFFYHASNVGPPQRWKPVLGARYRFSVAATAPTPLTGAPPHLE
ncbi:MAG: hypothetical protein KKB50_20540 [Planctomycetes bacterium]|nr:hypothetical protein [Planctomycetota bacterium]